MDELQKIKERELQKIEKAHGSYAYSLILYYTVGISIGHILFELIIHGTLCIAHPLLWLAASVGYALYLKFLKLIDKKIIKKAIKMKAMKYALFIGLIAGVFTIISHIAFVIVLLSTLIPFTLLAKNQYMMGKKVLQQLKKSNE